MREPNVRAIHPIVVQIIHAEAKILTLMVALEENSEDPQSH